VSGRRRRNAGLKFGVQRDINVDRVAMLVLRLPEFDPAIAHVLRTEPNGILTTAARVEQQIEREACVAADRVSIEIVGKWILVINTPRSCRVVAVVVRPLLRQGGGAVYKYKIGDVALSTGEGPTRAIVECETGCQ
jgi:hypothetical protein